MFWRFGFHNASTIDSLLDKEDVALEAILDEDDLLQECKAQNTRLLDYFQRPDVLQRLLGYVTGQIEGEERGQFKYPYVATEVLCSDIWSIVETCVNQQEHLLAPFWETVLDKSPEDMKTQMVMAAHFAKINAVFISKKPAEMLAFIQSQPSVVERLLRHIETPSFVDLLVRIIQMDEQPRGAGVLEWLSSENLMARLIELLSPEHNSDIHTVVAELIKGIISMATPSPGAGLTEGLQNGPASNRFARELAHRDSVTKLATYMLNDFGPGRVESPEPERPKPSDGENEPTSPLEEEELPNTESYTSSVIQSISVIIELIRKNNSDYFEPYLFHTLRNRLIQVQQQPHSDDGRETLERAMKEMVDRMGVVHLGPVLEIMCDRLDTFQKYLRTPRCLNGPVPTTIGKILPLTFERYRICELFAELLHCSNMSLLNRSPEFNHLYDSDGRLQGGLAALEDLARVIAPGTGQGGDHETMDEGEDEIEPSLELPVTNSSHDSPSAIDSDEDMSDGDDDEPGSSDDEAMEEIIMHDDPTSKSTSSLEENSLQQPPVVVPSSPNAASMPSPSEIAAQGAALSQRTNSHQSSDSDNSTIGHRSQHSRKNSRKSAAMDAPPPDTPIPVGERLKRRFLDMNVLSTLLDLFFEYPWNNFLHSAVYDLIHQILTGHVDTGLNRELALALFRDAHLMHRIVDGQKQNDIECEKPKGVRLGYMGHLTLISEDVITALERFPPELRLSIVQYAPEPGWDEYVTGRYEETKKRDSCLLGGGKPIIAPGAPRAAHWKVDEADSVSPADGMEVGGSEPRGEFRRAGSVRPTRENSADFGPAPMEDEEEEEEEDDDDDDGDSAPHFARYLAQEMQSSDNFGSSGSDEDDEDGGWLSQSTFTLSTPPISSRHQSIERRPLDVNGFEDVFNPDHSSGGMISEDPFSSSDDDTFGPFSDSAAASGSDPFTFTSSFSDEIEDSSFDGFGEFGDFQTAQDGELTPTTDSWTFSGDPNASDEVSSDSPTPSPSEPDSPEADKRMTVDKH